MKNGIKPKYALGRNRTKKTGRKAFTTTGSALARRRLAKGLSQYELADIIGCEYYEISCWERGKRRPRDSTLAALADALGCTAEELMDEAR